MRPFSSHSHADNYSFPWESLHAPSGTVAHALAAILTPRRLAYFLVRIQMSRSPIVLLKHHCDVTG